MRSIGSSPCDSVTWSTIHLVSHAHWMNWIKLLQWLIRLTASVPIVVGSRQQGSEDALNVLITFGGPQHVD